MPKRPGSPKVTRRELPEHINVLLRSTRNSAVVPWRKPQGPPSNCSQNNNNTHFTQHPTPPPSP